MALIKCKNCGKEISDKSKQCIHCGKELSNNSTDDLESKNLKQQVETTKTKEDTKKQVKNISNKMIDIFRYFIGTIFLISILGLKGFQIITMLCMVLLIYPFSANYLYSKINIPKALRIIIPFALLMFTFMIDENFDKYMEESRNKSNQNQQQNEIQQNDNSEKTTNDNKDKKENNDKVEEQKETNKKTKGTINFNEKDYYNYFSVKGTWYNNKNDGKLNAYAIVETKDNVINVDFASFTINITCDYQINSYPKETHTLIARISMNNERTKEEYSTIGGISGGQIEYVKNCNVKVKNATGTILVK